MCRMLLCVAEKLSSAKSKSFSGLLKYRRITSRTYSFCFHFRFNIRKNLFLTALSLSQSEILERKCTMQIPICSPILKNSNKGGKHWLYNREVSFPVQSNVICLLFSPLQLLWTRVMLWLMSDSHCQLRGSGIYTLMRCCCIWNYLFFIPTL